MPYWWRPLRGLQLEGGRSVHKELEETDRGQGGEKESHSQVCSGGQESARAQVQLPWTPPPTHTHTGQQRRLWLLHKGLQAPQLYVYGGTPGEGTSGKLLDTARPLLVQLQRLL